MDWLLALLLTLLVDGKPAPMRPTLQRANTRARGLAILKGKRVMMFGDSMVNCGINVWLEPQLKKHGVKKYVTRSWASSTTVSWSKAKKLEAFLWRHDPDIVFVVLGTNELFHPHPWMKIRPMKRLLRKLGKRRSVYWIGPPTWAKEYGIIKTMKGQLPPGHFFDSGKVKMARKKDGYHPTFAGSKTWAKAIWRWFSGRLKAPRKRRAPPRRRARPKRRP